MPPPTTYTRELADWICDQLRKDRTLTDICSAPNMPSESTVQQWARQDVDGFEARYRAAQRRRGPPTQYTPEIGDRICEELGKGRTVDDICGDEGMPSQKTIWKWANEDRGDFGARYRELRTLGSSLTYPEEIVERICHELSAGRTLRDICRQPDMPDESTVRLWATHDRNGFAARYRTAREHGFLSMADETNEIVDDGRNDWMERQKASGEVEMVNHPESVARSRLRFDQRRWLLGKALPYVYGDRADNKSAPEQEDRLARLMRAIDGETRGLESGE